MRSAVGSPPSRLSFCSGRRSWHAGQLDRNGRRSWHTGHLDRNGRRSWHTGHLDRNGRRSWYTGHLDCSCRHWQRRETGTLPRQLVAALLEVRIPAAHADATGSAHPLATSHGYEFGGLPVRTYAVGCRANELKQNAARRSLKLWAALACLCWSPAGCLQVRS